MPKPDENYLSYADVQNDELQFLHHLNVSPAFAEQYDDLLKISRCRNMVFRHLVVAPNGRQREDAIDIMRFSRDVYIDGAILRGGKYVVTIKGGSCEILLNDVLIERPANGREGVDIDIGNFSHNALGRTGRVVLRNVLRSDGKPVRVRVGWADEPVIIGGNVKVLRFQSLLLKAYVYVKAFLAGHRGPW